MVLGLGLLLCASLPIALAATSPLLAWRDPLYIAGGFAGVVALALLLIQPALAAGVFAARRVFLVRLHRICGLALVIFVILHVAGLWATSPPDVIDALFFVSPTPFAVWGVIAMWAVFAAALIAILHSRLGLGPKIWRRWHMALTGLVAGGTVLHALLIEGAMEPVSKWALCLAVIAMTAVAISRSQAWRRKAPRQV